jgi:hypothetical protein
VKQLGRFLRLERPRKETEREVSPAPRRFETLEEATPPDRPPFTPHSAGALERFTPQPDPPLAIQAPDAEQPFVRCPRCGADSVRHAVVCRQCESRLDTDQAQAFNLRVWEEIRAAREREATESAHRRQQADAAAQADAAERRRLIEALAADVGARERARLELEGPWFRAGPGWWGLSQLRDTRLRVLILSLAVGLPVVLLMLSRRGSFGFWTGLFGALVAVLLLMPRAPRS